MGRIDHGASSTDVELSVIGPSDAGGIEQALAAFAHEANGGVIVTGSPLTEAYHESIISFTKRYRLPAIILHRGRRPCLIRT
jgi:hypothetical protein